MEKKEIKVVKKESRDNSQVCKYNPLKDVMEVIPDLGVDIDDMLQTGIVKNSSETLDNNGIDNPDMIVGRIRDGFDALDAARIIKKYGKKSPAAMQTALNNLTDSNANSK